MIDKKMEHKHKTALVVGASGGIGKALVTALETRGYRVTGLSQSTDGLDITLEDSIAAKLAHLDTQFDLIIVATGVLTGSTGPEKTLKALSSDELITLFSVNAIGPALVLKHSTRLLPRDRPAVFVALSARVGSIGDNNLGGWYSYRASKAALNQLIKTASIELKRTHKNLACAVLHPGTVATGFTSNYPNHPSVSPQQTAGHLLDVIEGLTPEDTGKFLDWAGKKVPW